MMDDDEALLLCGKINWIGDELVIPSFQVNIDMKVVEISSRGHNDDNNI